MGLRSRLRNNIKSRRINIFIVFLFLAVLFSLLTKLSMDYTHTFKLELQAVNVPEDKIIITDTLQSLDVTLTTYGFKLIRYGFKKPVIKVDFGGLDRTGNMFIWTKAREFSNVVDQFDPNVRIEAINPDTLLFKFDKNSVKSVPVILDKTVDFIPGFDLTGNFQIEPDSVRVIGPKILVDTVKVVKTKPLALKGVNSDIDVILGLEPLNNNQLSLSGDTVRITASVEKFTEGSVLVPVIVKNLPQNRRLSIYPKKVEVIYYASLDAFKTIVPNSFIVECDFSDLQTSGLDFMIPKIVTKPGNVKEARLSTKRIEFILQ